MSLYYMKRPAAYSPFHELRDAMRSFQDSPLFQLSRNIDSAFSDVARPSLDFHENDKTFEIKADVPGMPKEALKLTFSDDGSTLTLSGEVKRDWTSSSQSGNTQAAVTDSQPIANTSSSGAATSGNPSEDNSKELSSDQPTYQERFYGSFSRSLRFPSLIDPEKTTASLKDGVLSIVVPKREVGSAGKSISIS